MNRTALAARAETLLKNNCLVLDTETTGLGKETTHSEQLRRRIEHCNSPSPASAVSFPRRDGRCNTVFAFGPPMTRSKPPSLSADPSPTRRPWPAVQLPASPATWPVIAHQRAPDTSWFVLAHRSLVARATLQCCHRAWFPIEFP